MAKKKKDLKFNLIAQSIDYFHLENPKEIRRNKNVDLLEEGKVDINVEATDLVIPNKPLFQIHFRFTFSRTNVEVCKLITVFDFELVNIKPFVTKGKLKVDKEIRWAMYSIAYSTSRGIIWSKLSDTYLKSVIIPVIYKENLQLKDCVYDISQN